MQQRWRRKDNGAFITLEVGMDSTRLLSLNWTRGPSGVYRAGRYTLLPVSHGIYAVQVDGVERIRWNALDLAKNWCEEHRRGREPDE